MTKQFSFVLVDDSDLDIFINQKFLTLSGLASSITSFNNAEDAIQFVAGNTNPREEKVFLVDLQLTGKTGFDFLDAFCELDEHLRKNTTVFLLSSTVDSTDLARASAHPCLKALLPKPLDIEKLKKLLIP